MLSVKIKYTYLHKFTKRNLYRKYISGFFLYNSNRRIDAIQGVFDELRDQPHIDYSHG